MLSFLELFKVLEQVLCNDCFLVITGPDGAILAWKVCFIILDELEPEILDARRL